MHVLGQLMTLVITTLIILNKAWLLLLLTPFIVYPFAWLGHFIFEKNKPAAFKNPLWAKISDWIMLKDWITGKIER